MITANNMKDEEVNFRDDGNLYSRETQVATYRHWDWYQDDGSLRYRYTYKGGTLQSITEWYREDGILCSHEIYKKGESRD